MTTLNLPDSPAASVLGGVTPAAPKKQPKLRSFDDAAATRTSIYDSVLGAAKAIEPVEDGRYRLKLSDVDWHDPERFTRKQRKQAVLGGETLSRRLKGTWTLEDAVSGQVLQQRKQIVARVPYLSSMGTFTHQGNEYTVTHQQRLLPGVFARVKDNGELESHVNVLPGEGVSHRYFLDPEKSLFKLRLHQAEMPLLPLLHELGASDNEVRAAWGNDIHAANYKHLDSGGTLKKLAARLLRKKDLESPQAAEPGGLGRQLKAEIERMRVDPDVMQRTLGKPYTHLNKDVILDATKKLLAISRGEADPDDRDHLANQVVYGPEDLFAERIRRDHGYLRRQLLRKISLAGSLDKMPPGALTPQIEQVLLGSGLAQALEEINPAEVLDKQGRMTRMGEGGIPSLDAIPDEARSVQPSHMGFLDPLRTPESFKVGVDLQTSYKAKKGDDGRMYTEMLNPRTKKREWKSPQDLANLTVATNDALDDPVWAGSKRVPALKGGKIDYVPRQEIDYVLPHFEHAFSPVGNMIPFKSMVKGQRASMAGRMLTQALPLVDGEAPLVQNAMPGSNGTRSFDEEYGRHMGAVHAEKPGTLEHIDEDGVMHLRHQDGTKSQVELYQHHPFNRKTYLHQTPTVQPGDKFAAGQLLARSNYTDAKGVTALGANLRTAYMPWMGYNHNDAVVVSESAARDRLASEHMYQHDLEVTDRHKVGKRSYIGLFPARFDRKTLEQLDEHGTVRPGTRVEHGQPLILAAKERDRSLNKVHKKGQSGYNDESVLWEHHDPGVVTDVVWGKHGPTVLVKSIAGTQVGDKLSGRYGDKGVIAAIVPDHEMPHNDQGEPYEILVNPTGTPSRTNPGQHAEAQIGKLAKKLGHPIKVPDFGNEADLTAWVRRQLAQHGLSDTESVTIPKFGIKVPDVQTGHRFFMKLHHTSESKAQGRGGGGYSQDETPAKGGAQGCFLGDTLVKVVRSGRLGAIDIAAIVQERLDVDVVTRSVDDALARTKRVSDWFHYQVRPEELVTLRLENSALLTCTRGHEFVLADGSRRRAGELEPGDDLMEV